MGEAISRGCCWVGWVPSEKLFDVGAGYIEIDVRIRLEA